MDVMIDLETLDTSPTASIVSIGAAAFTWDEGICERFYSVVDRASCREIGLTESQATVEWWECQEEAARQIFSGDNESITDSLNAFSKWLDKFGNSKMVKIWGNGSDFDNVILANAYKSANIHLPWRYYNNRCYRTAKSIYGDGSTYDVIPRKGTYHHALDDAVHQALNLIQLRKQFTEGKMK